MSLICPFTPRSTLNPFSSLVSIHLKFGVCDSWRIFCVLFRLSLFSLISNSCSAFVPLDVKEDVGFAFGDGGGVSRRDCRVVEVEPLTAVNSVRRVMATPNAGTGLEARRRIKN